MNAEPQPGRAAWAQALLAILLAASPLIWAASMQSSPTAYAAGVQEDGALEWMTFWGFVLAAALFFLRARSEFLQGTVSWFTLGLALFCLLVALEEISWGQRIFGYRPPSYFLEQNYQQELNFHNLVDTTLRKSTLKAIIIGYGIVLPLFGLFRRGQELLDRLRIHPPPWRLAPAFLIAAVAYEIYPWKFTGELVELVLALAFLFSALLHLPAGSAWPGGTSIAGLLSTSLVVLLLGWASGFMTLRLHRSHPANIQAAQTELGALEFDLLALGGADLPTECGQHKRLFTWVSREDAQALFRGRFAALVAQGLPAERADFFIDPWNSPYWVRHRCTANQQKVTLYSFGPNRRRDSEPSRLGGDDVGVTIERPRKPEG